MKPQIFAASFALGLTACAGYPPAPYGPARAPYGPPQAPYGTAYGAAMVTTTSKAPFGTYLVDGRGRALYILEGTRGGGMNRCMGDCLRVWPPLHGGAGPAAGPGINPAQLRTMPMHGAPHLAYAGWPLYYYHRDRGPGDTTGQHVTDRWGTWHLLSPSGQPIRPVGRY